MKKLLVILCMVTCIFSMTANAASKTEVNNGYTKEELQSNAENLYKSLASFTDEQIAQYLASGDEITIEAVESWSEIRGDLGDYVGIGEFEVEDSADGVITKLVIDYSETDMLLTVAYNQDYTVSSILAEKAEGTGNSIAGWGIFVIALVVVLGAIGYSNRRGKKDEDDDAVIAPNNASSSVRNIMTNQTEVVVVKNTENSVKEENPMEDLELVAVITAAIAASMDTSTDGFVVRSINRRIKRTR
jgi:Na+-transporting methylmalonyl-CoA/oxaloacetate decarboxylase gamma subunit